MFVMINNKYCNLSYFHENAWIFVSEASLEFYNISYFVGKSMSNTLTVI